MAVSGTAIAAAGAGALFIYAGIKGFSILQGIQTIVQGKSPGTLTQTQGIVGTYAGNVGDTIAAGVNAVVGGAGHSDAKTALKAAAAQHGWDTGANWTALDAVEMQEAGYNPTAKNGSSGAYGLAQSLGHGFSGGPASNGVNEYGGEGLSPDQSRAASLGDPGPQAVWMVNYIASRYGNPVVAEQFHLANNWY